LSWWRCCPQAYDESRIGAIVSGPMDIVFDTVGLDMEKIQAYVRYQDMKDQQVEQRQLGL